MEIYQEGIVSLTEHGNTIRELKEKWAKELMTQKIYGEELEKELRELKNFKSRWKKTSFMLFLMNYWVPEYHPPLTLCFYSSSLFGLK